MKLLRDIPRNTIIFLIRFYRRWISPMMAAHCRYQPTCSHYLQQAVQQHGVCKGLRLGLQRLCKCHPWGGSGYDPVPEPNNLSSET